MNWISNWSTRPEESDQAFVISKINPEKNENAYTSLKMPSNMTLQESTDSINVHWMIDEKFSLRKEHGAFIDSPTFSLGGSKWCLRMCLKYQSIYYNSGWIGLQLKKKHFNFGHRVAFKLGIMKNNGTEFRSFNFVFSSDTKYKASGNNRLLSLLELERMKEKVVRNGYLTVFCVARLERMNQALSKVPSTTGIENLSEDFKSMLLGKQHTDVIVKVQDQMFSAHKFVLVSRSAVFASMFKHDTLEKRQGVVDISDCDPDSFKDFLYYLYTGKLDVVSPNKLISLYKTSDKYDVKELKHECVERMVYDLCVDSFTDVLHLAELHSELELQTAVINFFIKNIKPILSSMKWQSLLVENPSLANKLFFEFVNSLFEY